MRPRDGPVGVLGGQPVQSAVAQGAGADGRNTITGSVSTVLEHEVSLVIVSDLTALSALLSAEPEAPILPVGVPETTAVGPADLEMVVRKVLDGEAVVRDHRILQAETADRTVAALYEFSLMTGEPARISEYAVTAGTAAEQVTHVRADGMVVATPLGSAGYAHRVGGPRVRGDVDGVVVVPVSPFSVARDSHVVSLPVTVSVERDEGLVELFADSRLLGTLERSAPVTIRAAGMVPVLSLDEKT
jgi:NAD+ kinase